MVNRHVLTTAPRPVFVSFLQRGKWHIIWSPLNETMAPDDRDLTRCGEWPRLSATWPTRPQPSVMRWDYRTTDPVASHELCRLCARSFNSAYRPSGYALDRSGPLTEVIAMATPAPVSPSVLPSASSSASPPPHDRTRDAPPSAKIFADLPAHVPLDMPSESGPRGRRLRLAYWIARFEQELTRLNASLRAFPDDLLLKIEHDALASMLADLRQELATQPTETDWAFVAGLYTSVGRRTAAGALSIDLSLQGQDAILRWLVDRFGGQLHDEIWVLEEDATVDDFLAGALASVPVTSGAPIDHLVDTAKEDDREPWDDLDESLT